jgi:ferric-dicitrate binding protein FerR (iron transport regulator)
MKNKIFDILNESVMGKIWEETDAVADESTLRDLKALHSRIRKAKIIPLLRRIAAVVLLPLAGAALMYWHMPEQQEVSPEWMECFVPGAERKEVTLPDGTHVWLNSGSVLIYDKEFHGKARMLYLNGEAIFNVARNREKPFIVKTNYMNIEALGTVFNVEAYSDAEYTTATLGEGKALVGLKNLESVE